MARAHHLSFSGSPTRSLLLRVFLCRRGRRHGEAEQRGQAEAAAALQGRPVCHSLGLYSSRDLPGSVGEAPGRRGEGRREGGAETETPCLASRAGERKVILLCRSFGAVSGQVRSNSCSILHCTYGL